MQYILDVVILAIAVGCFILGYYKGLIKSIFGLAAVVIALIGAITFKAPVAKWADETFVHQPVRNYVLSIIAETPVLDYESALSDIDVTAQIKSMPKELQTLLEMVGIDTDEIISEVSSRAKAGTNEAKNKIVDMIADPISAVVSGALAFVGLFVLLLILCMIAARLLSMLIGLIPLGKQANRIGGGLLGLVKAAAIILVVCAVAWDISVAIKPQKGSLLARDTISKTVIFKEIVKIDPLCKLTK